ncbi:MAG: hypothetical protein J6T04_09915 [Bacteroidales bacterium]|nr:hypothetical protein [Bacteroidales bacterium]
MKKTLAIIIAISAGLFVSCTQEDKIETKPEVEASKGLVFSATIEPATKIALEKEGDTYNVLWRSGDMIAVRNYVFGTPPVGFYTTTSNTSHGDFTYDSGTELTTGSFYAFYPAEYWSEQNAAYPITQNYTPGVIKAPMFAYSTTTNLQFKNIGGLIRINLKTPLTGKKIKKIYLYSTAQSLSGTITNITSLNSNPTATVDKNSPAQHPVVLDCGNNGVEIGSDPTPFYIAVPANTYTDLTIGVITVEGIKQTYTLNSDKSIVVERSSIADITLTFNKDPEIIDLSENGTANTYIAMQRGYYKFKATVKGNGGLDPVTGTTATEINKNDISGVTVLWDLKQRGNVVYHDGKMQAHDIYYHDGYIYFYKNYNLEGNSYVAIFKDKEGGTDGVYDKDIDEILWSWLIWATNPGTVVYNSNQFLDRNIGSVTTGTFDDGSYTAGFSYQWGRPAPFASSLGQAYTPFNYVPPRTSVFSFENIGNGTTVDHAISHPVTFFYHGSRSNWMPDNATCMTLWSDNVKTIYDPSPIGWKVPSKAQLTGITSAISFYGSGFIGPGSSSDFGYGNPGSVLLWSSTCDNSDGFIGAWANAYGSMYKKYGSYPDVYMMSGMPIRPVIDEASLTYADLSAEGTANCYIISSSGDYKFKATVRGNGAADLAGVSKNISASEIASAALVWASYGTTTAPGEAELLHSIRYSDGYVYFRVPETYRTGNAVVAVKNSSGTVLWSWHLWFTDADINGSVQTYPSGAKMMDRNLGALSKTFNSSNTFDWGLMYQWGRKDPILNSWSPQLSSGYVSSSNAASVYRPAVLGTTESYVTAYQENSTVAAANRFPQYVYVASNLNSTYNQKEWASDMTDALWAENKTIFDPCPSGWKVPGKSVWEGSFMTSLASATLSNNAFTVSGIRYPSTAVRMPQAIWISSFKYCNGGLILENLADYHVFFWAYNGQLHKEKFTYEYESSQNPPVTPGVYSNPPIESTYAQDSDYITAYFAWQQEAGMPSHSTSYFYRTRPGAIRCVRE